MEKVRTLGEDDMAVEEAGSEESLKDRELNLRRHAHAKVDEQGKTPNGSTAESSRNGRPTKERGIWTKKEG